MAQVGKIDVDDKRRSDDGDLPSYLLLGIVFLVNFDH